VYKTDNYKTVSKLYTVIMNVFKLTSYKHSEGPYHVVILVLHITSLYNFVLHTFTKIRNLQKGELGSVYIIHGDCLHDYIRNKTKQTNIITYPLEGVIWLQNQKTDLKTI